jgi:threonyl-tRNA synthetase
MFAVGGREAEKNAVSVRRHGTGDLGVKSIEEATKLLLDEITSKNLTESTK